MLDEKYILDKKQRSAIMELFADGVKISKIARRVGVSRQSIYPVLDSVERVPEIKHLKKELKVTELMKKINELREPMKGAPGLDDIRRAVDSLFCKVLALWYTSPNIENVRQFCIYCGEPMVRVEGQKPSGKVVPGYRCERCNKDFPFP